MYLNVFVALFTVEQNNGIIRTINLFHGLLNISDFLQSFIEIHFYYTTYVSQNIASKSNPN